jgi:hypothetical protein
VVFYVLGRRVTEAGPPPTRWGDYQQAACPRGGGWLGLLAYLRDHLPEGVSILYDFCNFCSTFVKSEDSIKIQKSLETVP